MPPPFRCLLSGEVRDIADVAAILHAKRIETSHLGPNDPRIPDYCPSAASSDHPNIILELSLRDRNAKRSRLTACVEHAPQGTPLLSCSVTVSATEQASWITKTAQLIGFSYLPSHFGTGLIEVAPTIHTGRAIITAVEDFAIRMAVEISIVQDRVGMVLPRVLASLVNEAFFAVMEGVAEPPDIDSAMMLGTSYPQGPVAWGQSIGLPNVVAILDALYQDTGEDRYRIAPLLRQMALAASK